MKKFATVRRYDDHSGLVETLVKGWFLQHDYIYDENDPELVIVIGGDGTFLRAVHHFIDKLDHIAFCGIHTGTLGFFSDYTDQELDEFFSAFLNRQKEVVEYQLLEIDLDGKQKFHALNEMRIENSIHTQVIEIKVNGQEFETFRGTGVCVSTQLGSSAYNRSLGGAVIQDGLPLIQLAEIAGIHNRAYQSLGGPIVMREDTKLCFSSADFSGANLCHDHLSQPLDGAHTINIELSSTKVKIYRYKHVDYFKRLQNLF